VSEVTPDFRLPDVLPSELPVMALLRGALLPGSISPFNVGRASSVVALDGAKDGLILVVPQKNPDREPGPSDLMEIGTLARILKSDRRNGGRFVVVQGLCRVVVDEFVRTKPGFIARFAPVREVWPDSPEAAALAASFDDLVKETAGLLGDDGRARAMIDKLPTLLRVDGVAGMLDLSEELRRELLANLDPLRRAEIVLVELTKARDVLEARKRIDKRVRGESRDRQREAILRQQLDAIRKELGEDEGDEVSLLRARIEALELTDEVRDTVEKELRRLERTNPNSPERGVIVDWLTRVAELPWSTWSASDVDFDALEAALDESHFGLDDVKRQVLEYLSVRKLAGRAAPTCCCSSGPPGWARPASARPSPTPPAASWCASRWAACATRPSCAGHRRTYIGARPGRIIEGLRRAGTADPVVLLDEVDKLTRGGSATPRGPARDPRPRAEPRLRRPLPRAAVRPVAGAVHRDRQRPVAMPGPCATGWRSSRSRLHPAEKLRIARRHLCEGGRRTPASR
jgi:ATP-dependent Lon protease